MNMTIARLFDRYEDAAATVTELEAAGVPHRHISVIANNADGRDIGTDTGTKAAKGAGAGAAAGAVLGGGTGLLAALGVIVLPGVGPVLAAGWLAATLAGAAAGAGAGAAAGGLVGALTKDGVNSDDANVYAEAIRRGGTLVLVKTDDKWVGVANEIVNRRTFIDPAIRGAAYRAAGWNAFDSSTPPFNSGQIKEERSRYPTN